MCLDYGDIKVSFMAIQPLIITAAHPICDQRLFRTELVILPRRWQRIDISNRRCHEPNAIVHAPAGNILISQRTIDVHEHLVRPLATAICRTRREA